MQQWFFAIFMAITAGAKAADFCATGEKILFSCISGEKLVSLCASNDASRNAGYVQYRVINKGKLEFEYPSSKLPPSKFFFESSLLWAADDEQQVHFQNEQYTYLIYDRSFKTSPKDAKAGIFVYRNGKFIGGLDCKDQEDPMARAFSASLDKSLFQRRDFPY